jgi:hypothetical protein
MKDSIVLTRGAVSRATQNAFALGAHHGRWLLATRFRCVFDDDADQLAADISGDRIAPGSVRANLSQNGTGVLHYARRDGTAEAMDACFLTLEKLLPAAPNKQRTPPPPSKPAATEPQPPRHKWTSEPDTNDDEPQPNRGPEMGL